MKQANATAQGLRANKVIILRVKVYRGCSLYMGDGAEYEFIVEIKETDAGGEVQMCSQVQPVALSH